MFTVDKEIEVRYAETDQMGVVYHANYLVWLELGRTAFVEAVGYKYSDMEAQGVMCPVSNVQLSYKRSTHYGDKVIVRTAVKKVTPFRTIYQSQVLNEQGELCLEGEVEVTCVAKNSFKFVNFKKTFPEWFEKYQALATGESL